MKNPNARTNKPAPPTSSIFIDVKVEDAEWPHRALRPHLHHLAMLTLEHLGRTTRTYQMGLTLTTDPVIQHLNRQYRRKNKATNVLSFPLHTPAEMAWLERHPHADEIVTLGDVVMAYQTIEKEAKEKKIPFRDHVSHLFIHGLLHLMGFDHQTSSGAQQMETLEINILHKIGVANPYAST